MKLIAITAFLVSTTWTTVFSQTTFKTVYGTKANYSIGIPSTFTAKDVIGANVDMKYANSEGASIITVVKMLPNDLKESDIDQMNSGTDNEFIEQLEANGLQNITLIKKGFIDVNGVRCFFAYYRSPELYYHTITQFRKGKLINLLCTCQNSKKDLYMPYFFRTVNSLKS